MAFPSSAPGNNCNSLSTVASASGTIYRSFQTEFIARRFIYRHEMNDAAHRQLLERLRAVKGMVVLCGYPSALYEDYLPDWQRITRAARAAGSHAPRTETLWLNPQATHALKTTTQPPQQP